MKYADYMEYIIHQGSKLENHSEEVRIFNERIKKLIFDRYNGYFDFKAKTIICLGARMGGEVFAFKSLGAVAIGIDINPGAGNEHVLYGDFHNVNFPDSVFDYIYCNCIDHVFNLDLFIAEVNRLLKKTGILFLEIAIQEAGEFETIDTMDISSITKKLDKVFITMNLIEINNGWDGKLFVLKKN